MDLQLKSHPHSSLRHVFGSVSLLVTLVGTTLLASMAEAQNREAKTLQEEQFASSLESTINKLSALDKHASYRLNIKSTIFPIEVEEMPKADAWHTSSKALRDGESFCWQSIEPDSERWLSFDGDTYFSSVARPTGTGAYDTSALVGSAKLMSKEGDIRQNFMNQTETYPVTMSQLARNPLRIGNGKSFYDDIAQVVADCTDDHWAVKKEGDSWTMTVSAPECGMKAFGQRHPSRIILQEVDSLLRLTQVDVVEGANSIPVYRGIIRYPSDTAVSLAASTITKRHFKGGQGLGYSLTKAGLEQSIEMDWHPTIKADECAFSPKPGTDMHNLDTGKRTIVEEPAQAPATDVMKIAFFALLATAVAFFGWMLVRLNRR